MLPRRPHSELRITDRDRDNTGHGGGVGDLEATMTPLPIAERGPEKPKFGEPCNGCGFCCAAEVCVVGKAMHGDDCPAPCPSMEWVGGRFGCGLVRLAESCGPNAGLLLRMMLGIGKGCSMPDEPDARQPNEKAHTRGHED